MDNLLSALPAREALTQPLLAALYRHGALTPSEAAALVAEELDLPDEVRNVRIPLSNGDGRPRHENALQYRLRWVHQTLSRDDMLAGSVRGLWEISRKGRAFYVRATPGVLISVFETNLGTALCADANTLLQAVQNGGIQTYITSPPFPEISRAYGRLTSTEVHALVLGHLRALQPKLALDGNVFLNLGFTSNRDRSQSSYVERLLIALEDSGYKLLQRLFWENPCKPPAGTAVTHKRTRLTEKVEIIYRLGLSTSARGDNRRLLKAYSPEMLRCLNQGGDIYGQRPSGHGHQGQSFSKDNGGAIPGNVFRIPHENHHHRSIRALRARGLPKHNAAMPEALIEPLVLLTTDEGNVVGDCLGGGGSVARVCEANGRRWLYGDHHLNFVANASVLFEESPGFRRMIDPINLQQHLRQC